MHHIDDGHKALSQVISTYKTFVLSDANEAETRLKIIDEILINVLGWDKADFFVEQRVSEDGKSEFADYIIKTAFTGIIVEAKRVGASFVLPHRYKKMKLGGAISEGETGEAIRQVRDYCRKKSIPFAITTNGSAWIIFPAVRTDSIPFEDTQAIIFRSISDVEDRFVDFWELLSKERVLDGNLENELLGKDKGEPQDRCIRHTLSEPGYRLGRNAVFDYIEPAISESLSDEALLINEEALEACYVKTSERLKFDSRIQMHLSESTPPIGRPLTRIKSRKQQSKFEENVTTFADKSVSKFIVLLGPVGAGKTTFLNYTRKISARRLIDKKIIWMYIDFKLATESDDPRKFIYAKLLELIENDDEFDLGGWDSSIRVAYKDTIDNLKRGPLFLMEKSNPGSIDAKITEIIMKDRELLEPYVDKILLSASRNKTAYIIIDNVDQLENIDLQAAIFLEAQAITRKINFNIIISLRESTYLKHRGRPVFDAFQFDAYYVDPPSVLPVLSHRFSFAKRVLSGKHADLKTERGLTVSIDDLSCFFDLVSGSLLDENSGYMIECLSGGDIRRGLLLVREFLASGHTNADRAIAAYLADGNYKFPKHEVFKGAVLGSLKYYNDKHSLLLNLFDSKMASKNLQLLRLRLVEYLVKKFKNDHAEGVPFLEIFSSLYKFGISEPDVISFATLMQEKGFIKTVDGLAVRSASSFVPTRLAGYALKTLCCEFSYTEMCLLDSIIYDDDAWGKMVSTTKEIESCHSMVERMKLRRTRMELYLNYILLEEEKWIVDATRLGLSPEWSSPVVKELIIPSVRENLERAIRSSERVARAEQRNGH